MENTTSTYFNQQTGAKKKNFTYIIILVVIATLIGGIYLFRQPKKSNQTKVIEVEKKQPTPTERPKIDKKLVKIQVLNGTGTPGQAATVVEALADAGYSQDNITTNNAPDFNHSVTTISAKSGFEGIADDIKQNLTNLFDKIEIDSSPLNKDSEFDIVVITGGEKFEETTPTETPTPSPSEENETPTPTPSPTSSPTPSPTPTA